MNTSETTTGTRIVLTWLGPNCAITGPWLELVDAIDATLTRLRGEKAALERERDEWRSKAVGAGQAFDAADVIAVREKRRADDLAKRLDTLSQDMAGFGLTEQDRDADHAAIRALSDGFDELVANDFVPAWVSQQIAEIQRKHAPAIRRATGSASPASTQEPGR